MFTRRDFERIDMNIFLPGGLKTGRRDGDRIHVRIQGGDIIAARAIGCPGHFGSASRRCYDYGGVADDGTGWVGHNTFDLAFTS